MYMDSMTEASGKPMNAEVYSLTVKKCTNHYGLVIMR